MIPVYDRRWVYFIRPVGQRGPVKVGFSRDAEHRLREINKHSPVDLEIAAKIEVGARVEARFHALFVNSYWRDEWFHASALIDTTIEAIGAGTFAVDDLPRAVALHLVAKSRAAARLAA